MAVNRRLSPAELKARLQANLAVPGIKSSDPYPPSEEKSLTTSEAPESPREALDIRSAPIRQQESVRPTPNDQNPPKSTEIPTAGALNSPAIPQPQKVAETALSEADPADRTPAGETLPQLTGNGLGLAPIHLPTPIDKPTPAIRNVERREESPSASGISTARKRATLLPPSSAPKPSGRTVLHRRDQGAVLRGYRIPVDLHRQAERAKLGLASRRGSSLFWDELLQGAIDLLLDDIHKIAQELQSARRSPEASAPNTRVLQAAIRHDQDLRLRMLRIDLEELDGATVRLEEIWTWLIRQVVKNEG